ncbi:hypothetical protein G0D98_24070 [Pseudomonas savastanoi pv. phaseolicola]|uniref:hypothetical protein n=1 Tax=Pseudomonas syringae group TaxID=136849 RepID=UPI000F3E9EA1|nr:MULTISPECIES: hypothetical protein [Pseudomonas syringae group]MBM0212930.1 hypothetical protein [Pseudomonas syringae pv. maculicola]MBN3471480.1 hypothetical protein [Pseudomonas savastanoi pv. phaseolicola]MBN3478451.1 hypothetical protein [Pseudomonas savastanoi pv. phaseolicola]RMN22918.1 hypothetical protein ALQ66_03178 [Pseudomonas savastanoi pv. glycinea]BDF84363.1 hypothetical protein PSTH68_28110 [Pseudomonas syringae pv. theae]
MTNEQRIARGIDRAMDSRYSDLTVWERSFLGGLRDTYRKHKTLSMKQKTAAFNVFKRIGLDLGDI